MTAVLYGPDVERASLYMLNGCLLNVKYLSCSPVKCDITGGDVFWWNCILVKWVIVGICCFMTWTACIEGWNGCRLRVVYTEECFVYMQQLSGSMEVSVLPNATQLMCGNAQRSDTAVYRLTVSNHYGTETADVSVTVIGQLTATISTTTYYYKNT